MRFRRAVPTHSLNVPGVADGGLVSSPLTPARPADSQSIAVRAAGIRKAFGGVQALRSVDVSINQGSIHGLVGENGAGKSTLGRILAGALVPDAGEVFVRAARVEYRTPRDALADGVALIQQELALVPALSVLDNVFLGHEVHRGGVLSRAAMRDRFDALLERSGFSVEPEARVDALPIAQQQKVEILRALSREVQIMIFDEPTSSLGREDTMKLHEVVRSLQVQGITVIYVSHFLEEIIALADALTILRNGKVAATCGTSGLTVEDVVEPMLGRPQSRVFPKKPSRDDEGSLRLAVDALQTTRMSHPVTFEMRRGEILGLAGLVGSGRTEIARAICGADRVLSGEMRIDGERLTAKTPRDAVRAGIGFIPESRKEEGLVLGLSQRANVSLSHLSQCAVNGVVRTRTERARAAQTIELVRGDPSRVDEAVYRLSGGNQQKAVLAKALFGDPGTLILDEPTRGVDVGSKFSIYELIAELAEAGAAVLVIASEFEELIGLAHRVLVLRQGKIVGTLSGDSLTIEAVTRAALGAPTTATPDGSAP